MLENRPEINSIGGYGGLGFGGGFGGGGILEGIILASLLGRRGGGLFGGGDGDGGCAAETAIVAAITNAKDSVIAEGRALATAICATNDNIKDGNYAAAIQAERNTSQLSTQATAFAFAAERQADQNTAAILARFNQSETDRLRDELNEQRHHGRSKEIEITMIQNQNQQQQQFQAQNNEFGRRFDALFGQVAKAGQDIISVGSVLSGVSQTANPVNVKS